MLAVEGISSLPVLTPSSSKGSGVASWLTASLLELSPQAEAAAGLLKTAS